MSLASRGRKRTRERAHRLPLEPLGPGTLAATTLQAAMMVSPALVAMGNGAHREQNPDATDRDSRDTTAALECRPGALSVVGD